MKIIKRNLKGYYTVEGKEYLSVTSHFGKIFGIPSGVVQYYFCRYGWDEANRLRSESANYGTKIHHALHHYFFGEHSNGLDEISSRLQQIKDIYEKEGITPVSGEKILYSKKFKTAGTCDFIGVDKKSNLVFIDYKTGAKNKLKDLLQLSIYAWMFLEMFPGFKRKKIRAGVLYIGKSEEAKVKTVWYSLKDLQKGIKGFKAVQTLLKLQER